MTLKEHRQKRRSACSPEPRGHRRSGSFECVISGASPVPAKCPSGSTVTSCAAATASRSATTIKVRLLSRNRPSLNKTYPEIVDALAKQDAARFIVDGEIVAFEGRRTSFGRLQGRSGVTDPEQLALPAYPSSTTSFVYSRSTTSGRRGPVVGPAPPGYSRVMALCSAGRAEHRGSGGSDEQLPEPTDRRPICHIVRMKVPHALSTLQPTADRPQAWRESWHRVGRQAESARAAYILVYRAIAKL
jgi:hypothetical protein